MNVNGLHCGGNAQQLSAAVTHKSDTSMIPPGVYLAPGKRKPSAAERGTTEGETR